MADKLILVDTSILIDYYRKTDKEKTIWISLVRKGYSFAASAVTKFEIYSGATNNQLEFWHKIFQIILVLPFDEASATSAVSINNALKKRRSKIDIADLFIAATAVSNSLPIATLNRKHFERVDKLKIIE